MRNTLAVAACLALLLGTACTAQKPAPGAPAATRLGGLVPGQAVEIARKAALARGTKLDAYAVPQSAQLLIRNRHLCWQVDFLPKQVPDGPAPGGGGFTIFVDDQTGGVEFVAGTAKGS